MDSVEERDEDGYNLDDIQSKIERLEQVLTQNIHSNGGGGLNGRPQQSKEDVMVMEKQHQTVNLNGYPSTSSAGISKKQHQTSVKDKLGSSQQSAPLKSSLKSKVSSSTPIEEEAQKDSARGHKQLSPKYAPQKLEENTQAAPVADEDIDQPDEMGNIPQDMEAALNNGGVYTESQPTGQRDWDTEKRKLQEEEKLL
jgi:hypothetical protein